jgi:hypothetical protein
LGPFAWGGNFRRRRRLGGDLDFGCRISRRAGRGGLVDVIQRVDEVGDFRFLGPRPLVGLGLGGLGDAGEQVDSDQQNVDACLVQGQFPLLRGNKTILHRVSHFHPGIETDDAGCAFEGMRGPHGGLMMFTVRGISLQRQQAFSEYDRLAFHFRPEEVHHGKITQIVVHARLRLML